MFRVPFQTVRNHNLFLGQLVFKNFIKATKIKSSRVWEFFPKKKHLNFNLICLSFYILTWWEDCISICEHNIKQYKNQKIFNIFGIIDKHPNLQTLITEEKEQFIHKLNPKGISSDSSPYQREPVSFLWL